MMLTGFIGCGNMGGALAAVAAKALGGENVLTADLDGKKLLTHQKTYGTCPSDPETIARSADMIFLGVKPQVMLETVKSIAPILRSRRDHAVAVSMAAGIPASQIAEWIGDPGFPVIRIMPNLPASVGEGIILMCSGSGASAEDENALRQVMAPAGMIMELPENKIDAGSAVSGCGPAFVCLFTEAVVDGATRCGLPRDMAMRLALQMVAGTAKYALETGMDPAVLRGRVCSPAGSTIEGVRVLEENAARGVIMDAVWAAYIRSAELGKV